MSNGIGEQLLGMFNVGAAIGALYDYFNTTTVSCTGSVCLA